MGLGGEIELEDLKQGMRFRSGEIELKGVAAASLGRRQMTPRAVWTVFEEVGLEQEEKMSATGVDSMSGMRRKIDEGGSMADSDCKLEVEESAQVYKWVMPDRVY